MAFPDYPTIPDPWPDRAQGQSAFDSAVSGTFTFFGNLQTWATDWENEADGLAAALVAANLPSLTGQAGRGIMPNTAEDGVTFSAPLHTLAGHRNKIMNGQFGINQRGAASYTTTGYTLDRWRLAEGSGAACTIEQRDFALGQTDVPGNPAHYLHFARGTAGTVASLMDQRIEGVETLSGQTATVTAWVRASAATEIDFSLVQSFGTGGSPSADVSIGVVTNTAVTTAWVKKTFTVAIPSIAGEALGTNGDDYLVLRLRRRHDATNPTASVDIANVSLVAGDATNEEDPGAWRDETTERLLCARYYWEGTWGSAASQNFRVYSGDLSGVKASALIPFIVPMRATPTVAVTAVQGTSFETLVRGWGIEVNALSAGSSPERRIEFTLDSVDAEL